MTEQKAWHSRGYLPHFDRPEAIQSITFRLADSVPNGVLESWRLELHLKGGESANDPRSIELRRRVDRYADEGHGACWLRESRIADLVEAALLHFDGQRYRLLAWTIMPNHVHILIQAMADFGLGDIVHSWKSYTAKKANHVLNRKGDFWQPDYFDRFIRDEVHLAAAKEYIEQNPVKAGLVEKAKAWRWGSANRTTS
jgi:putative transposase